MNKPGIRAETARTGVRGRVREESGQILLLAAITMGMLLVVVALVIDVGHAMLVQRQLQAGVDAAALAGAQHLPDQVQTATVAQQYSPTPGSKNAVNTVDNAVTKVTVKCISGIPGCTRRDGGVNGLVVEASANVPTFFGRIAGINVLKVNAKATACSPCSVKPLDIMIVLDRTGSMCQLNGGQNDPACTDLNNAKQGVRTFLGFLDPSLDKVGLAFTPPVRAPHMVSNCGNPVGSGYKPWSGTPNPNVPNGHPDRPVDGKYYGYDSFWPDVDGLGGSLPGWDAAGRVWAKLGGQGMSDPSRYLVASLEGADGQPNDDYLIYDPLTGQWNLNNNSAVVQRLGCASGAGSTSYALSVEEAQHELERNGRGTVQNVIIFLSDGAANTTPTNIPTGHWSSAWLNRPCAAGVESANFAKGRGTTIYTIGYDLEAGTGAPERCRRPNANGHQNGGNPVEAGIDAYTAIQAMASSPQHFYNKPGPGQLNTIFTQIAIDLAGSRGRLVDNTTPNLLP